uniref:Amino acid transporter transmembrane domain-containing protein n=1 Tax=Mucochytrium quahogii TaxID=96639 RepID=A0A7S2W733_9STRA|mmetsp:Transcript_18087/g.30799  ORF Transcript_18087/g.30799 Transcript_18087/m.30799 type:complete len:457 (+) Transcript_18087:221-1591(+)
MKTSSQVAIQVKSYNYEEEDLQPRRGSLCGLTFNCINTCVGAGILGLSYSAAQVGYISWIIMLVFGAVTTQWGLFLLNKICLRLGGDQLSYGKVARAASKWTPIVVDLIVVIECFALGVLYLGTAADYLVDAAKFFNPNENPDTWYMTRAFMVTCGFIITIPLSFPRKVTILQYTSSMAVIAILFTVAIVVYYATQPINVVCHYFLHQNNMSACPTTDTFCCLPGTNNCCIGDVVPAVSSFQAYITAFPVVIVSFTIAPQVISMYNDLKNPTNLRLNIVTSSSIITVSLLYITAAISGYFTYGSMVSDNLLGSYPLSWQVTTARILVAFVVVVSFPLFFHSLRDSFIHSFGLIHSLTTKSATDITDPLTKTGKVIYYSVITLFLAFIYIASLANMSMSFLLAFVGSVCMSNLSFTLPGLFYWILFKQDGLTLTRITCPFMIAFGIFIMIINIVYGF